MGPYFPLHANLSGAGSLAQSTVIAFHTQHGITLLPLHIIVENVVLHTITWERNESMNSNKHVSVTERDIFCFMESIENVEGGMME